VARISCTSPHILDWCLTAPDVRNEAVVEFLAGGDPWPLTGAVLTAEGRADVSDVAPAITAVVTEIDITDGLFNVEWPAAQVEALLGSSDYWEGVWWMRLLEAGETLPVEVVSGVLSIKRRTG
jgi:hypothetical protein